MRVSGNYLSKRSRDPKKKYKSESGRNLFLVLFPLTHTGYLTSCWMLWLGFSPACCLAID